MVAPFFYALSFLGLDSKRYLSAVIGEHRSIFVYAI